MRKLHLSCQIGLCLLLLLVRVHSVHAQAQANSPNWPDPGRVSIGTFIAGAGGVDLLHVHGHPAGHILEPLYQTPAIRLSYGQSFDDFFQIGYHIGINSPLYSLAANTGDFILRTSPSIQTPQYGVITGDLVIASQRKGEAMRFTTTPSTATMNGVAQDVERMTILGSGNVGIQNNIPKGQLEVGMGMLVEGRPEWGKRIANNYWTDFAAGQDKRINPAMPGALISFPSGPVFPGVGPGGLISLSVFPSNPANPSNFNLSNTINLEQGQTLFFGRKADGIFENLMAIGRAGSGLISENKVLIANPVCIGTSDPGIIPGSTTEKFMLAVNGSMRARELIIEDESNVWQNWPDYVFAPDYSLMPIDELETWLSEHRHLPGIPSVADVAKNGVAVGELQRKLLEKVEELTLRVIKLHKSNESLQQEVQSLRK
jgi:hypothetical protein